MEIIGQKVSHEVFGKGEIVSREKNGDIFVYFADIDEKKRFQCPAAFGRYLTADDKTFAEAMRKESIEAGAVAFDPSQIKLPPREMPAPKSKQSGTTKTETSAKEAAPATAPAAAAPAVKTAVKETAVAAPAAQQTPEKPVPKAEKPVAPAAPVDKAPEAEKAAAPSPKERGKAEVKQKNYTAPERVNGVPQTYFVLQGGTFAASSIGGYIWAPYSQKDGLRQPYWDSLEFVEAGDILIHGEEAKIKAVSCVKAPFREAEKPIEFANKTKFTDKGRMIDCEYHIAKNPVPTKQYKDDIIRLVAGKRFSPFNNLGNGNNGYLYDLDREMAKIFIKALFV